ncbi:MAG TPA: 50S ribosomal protein L10 [Bacteroidales bacterium]|nr:50S ribosomal protein L10 [Bacteroidales bacterium]
MKRELKSQIIDSLTQQITESNYIYFTDISTLNVESTNRLRRLCFNRNVKLKVVKNSLLKKAIEKSGKDFSQLMGVLTGPTSIMIADVGNIPAKLIVDFQKNFKLTYPVLKAAYIDETCFVGNDQLNVLVNLKSKNELIGDVVNLLQSPIKNVISSLQSSGQKLSGILKTMSEK